MECGVEHGGYGLPEVGGRWVGRRCLNCEFQVSVAVAGWDGQTRGGGDGEAAWFGGRGREDVEPLAWEELFVFVSQYEALTV